ncbi:MAG: flavodoxin [Chloroflexota bacterium]|nr:MAG: flavodoxin [Chloroflexota bacterium]
MAKIGVFYGSSTSQTEYVAYDIHDTIEARLGPDTVAVHNIGSSDISEMLKYTDLILGIPTWDIGQLQVDWDMKWGDLEALDLTGHKVAIFGMGDQYGYPDTYLDAAGMLAETVLAQGGELVGYTPVNDTYQFAHSLFTEGKNFMGLALDEDHQPKLTKGRLDAWIEQVLLAFDLLGEEA